MITRLTATIRPITRLTGRMGVAFLAAPTGDATATPDKILAPETAYIATGKVVGTCTFDADTSDGTATEGDIRTGTSAYVDGVKLDGSLTPLDTSSATATASDILTGKTAYISDGTEATGTCDFNADTTDATAVENSLLYGHTAYGSAGTKLTGTGAYWQYAVQLMRTFQSAAIPASVTIYAPNCLVLDRTFYLTTGVSSVDITFGNATTFNYVFMQSSVATITLHGSIAACTALTSSFTSNNNLAHILGDPLNVASVTSFTGVFAGAGTCVNLVTVAFVPSTIKTDIQFTNSSLLSAASLVSIANGIGAAITLTLHATSKTNCDNIMVDNVAGVAVLGSAMSLSAFITNIKGATIA